MAKVRIKEAQYEDLSRFSAASGYSLTALVEAALCDYIDVVLPAAWRDLKKKQLAAGVIQ